MAHLPIYASLKDKSMSFNRQESREIISAKEFDNWYKETSHRQVPWGKQIQASKNSDEEENEYNYYPYIFRGVGDAKYKLYTSAQRLWIINNMEQWARKKYLQFVKDLIIKARDLPLLDKVFKFYRLQYRQRDFPIMSILQHYKAPTPLLDWTYNLDVSLFFATEYCTPSTSQNDIDQFFSIYLIDRTNREEKDIVNLFQFSQGSFPLIDSFYDLQDSPNNKHPIYYLSDFENNFSRKSSLGFKDQRPLTILFNQRIIPQEGLFIFNPSSTVPLEDSFNSFSGYNQVICVNIHKDLSDYIRRKIKLMNIDRGLIYPDLDQDAQRIREEVLYDLVK